MDLWDTAGQEKYRAIGRHFYKESYIVCLVYDITSKDSFKNLQDVWYPELLEYGEKYKIIALIGNKVDRYLEETVSEEEGKKFAAKINAVYKRTSALKGIGLDDLFNELIDKFLSEIKGLTTVNEKKKEGNIKIENVKDTKKSSGFKC